MVVHQAVGMNDGIISFRSRFEIGKESHSISATLENRLSFIPPGCNVIKGARVLILRGLAIGITVPQIIMELPYPLKMSNVET